MAQIGIEMPGGAQAGPPGLAISRPIRPLSMDRDDGDGNVGPSPSPGMPAGPADFALGMLRVKWCDREIVEPNLERGHA